MKLIDSMAYATHEEMIFGTSIKPVQTRKGLKIGVGRVIPEIVPHPRPGSEKSLKTLLHEFEKANGDALERCISVGHPALVIENEHVYQMTNNPEWGTAIAYQTNQQINEFRKKYGIEVAYRSTIADLRKPDMFDLRNSESTEKVLHAIAGCAEHADVVSIESLGGKEIFDHSIIREDLTGLLFAVVLGGCDVEWLWKNITEISKKYDCIPGGDSNCAQSNTAMFMAGGFISKDIPHSLASLCLVMGVSRTLVTYECGALGPGKDCAYENPIIKAITGIPISTEGKTSACAHMDLCGNVTAAVCDLWSNEAVEYNQMFGGSSSAVFAEILGYDTAAMNAALMLGFEKQYQACLCASDRYRSPHGFLLCPDNAWKIGKTIVDNNQSIYSRAKAAVLTSINLMDADKKLKFTAFERDSLKKYRKQVEVLPDNEGDFIDTCLIKYKKVKGFSPASYGL